MGIRQVYSMGIRVKRIFYTLYEFVWNE